MHVLSPQVLHDRMSLDSIALECLTVKRGLPTAACTGEASTFSHTGDPSSAQP